MAIKVQEVILREIARNYRPAEIIGISDRSMRRSRERFEKHGYYGLMVRRRVGRVANRCFWPGGAVRVIPFKPS
jgi:hypothetical protein